MTTMTRKAMNNERGAALLMALAVLALMAAMSVTMYAYISMETDDAKLDTNSVRAAWVARGGVEAAIAELQTAVATGNAQALTASPLDVTVPVYRQTKNTDPASEVPGLDESIQSKASVTISDESAKINVNLAPPAVLMGILKVDGDTARQIREKLPRIDGAAPTGGDESRRWLTSVGDLVARNLVTGETLTADRAAALTVHSAADLANPAGIVNLNSASSAVIEAALGVTPEVVAKVIAARPLNSLDAVVAAAGKDASGFNFKAPADNPTAMPRELGFSSRCFRIASKAEVYRLENGAPGRTVSTANVEAVVQFPENAAPRIVYWSESAETGR